MYFEETEIRSFFCNLAQTFPGAEIYCDILISWSNKKTKPHDTLSKIKATFKWALTMKRKFSNGIQNWNYPLWEALCGKRGITIGSTGLCGMLQSSTTHRVCCSCELIQ